MTNDDFENAEMFYNPEDENTPTPLQSILAQAEQQLGNIPGVNGLGLTKTEQGRDAICVYVSDQTVLQKLPSELLGLNIVSEISGDITPL